MKISLLLLSFVTLFAAQMPGWAADSNRSLSREAITAKYTDANSRFMDVDGIKVHYKDEGSGPVVLLVHGTYGDLSDWDEWAKLLKPNYRVIRLDLPAFGITGEIPSGNYSVDRMLSLIDGFMDNLKTERFAIAGVSYGGLVSWRYAATRTERVTALVLANSAGIEYGRSPTAAAAAATPSTAAAPAAQPSQGVPPPNVVTMENVKTFYDTYINDPARRTPELIQRKYDNFNIVNRDIESVVARKQYERGDPERILAHVRAPALVMWGDANQALSTTTADAFVRALKNACTVQRIIYKGGGHMINLDRPIETASDAKAFLDKQLRPGSRPKCDAPRS